MEIKLSFLSSFGAIELAVALFLAMLLAYWIGLTLAGRKPRSKIGPVESAVLGLLALLLAFTFGNSSSRYDLRRHIIVEEANDIGTAILRSDLYPEEERQGFRADFKEYVEARIAFFEAGMDPEKNVEALHRADEIFKRLWARAARLAQDRDNLIPSNQMVPALNAMIDIVTTRNEGSLSTVPDSIIWMLFALCWINSFIIGFEHSEGGKWRPGVIVFILAITIAVFIILDLDRPRRGLITLEPVNQNIVALRKMFVNE
ncbi:MAG: hypothetical protein DMF62_08540 [Acidobacteria bacterium]|nr:MAG: hypothetical protein DMF62_08540 [Acidobacteriota bacterium]